ncbi:hypothetical protein ABLE68_07805 [Nocardioides sp. CN2-186]|uniref:hypothetical protein n=1 Tax=Nocardioides tweenelious TaxID=3156607 RepID=UPI0032B40994
MRATTGKRTTRAALTIASGALLLSGLTACGGSDGGGSGSAAPDDASKDDFCTAFNGLYEKVMADMTSADTSKAIAAFKDWAADMKKVGTPDDMPEDARRGFEVFVDAAAKIDDDATVDDLQNLGDDLSQADQDAGDTFGNWASDNCPSGLPTDDASALSSAIPSDLPSDLPTDPSELESMMSELTASAGS